MQFLLPGAIVNPSYLLELLVIRPASAPCKACSLCGGTLFEEVPALILGVGKEGNSEQPDDEVGLDHLIVPIAPRVAKIKLTFITAAEIALVPASSFEGIAPPA